MFCIQAWHGVSPLGVGETCPKRECPLFQELEKLASEILRQPLLERLVCPPSKKGYALNQQKVKVIYSRSLIIQNDPRNYTFPKVGGPCTCNRSVL